MVNQRVKLKREIRHTNRTRKSGRLGTVTAINRKQTIWWVLWDGNKKSVRIPKGELLVESNIADIVNSIFVHKLK